MTDSDPLLFLTRPISGGLLLCTVLSVALAVWQHLRHRRKMAAQAEPDF
jgi:putative tricarboxylic transport membrane protein